jgi:NAD-dependent dihydropyrimidine dehydrogenase PreA subunit
VKRKIIEIDEDKCNGCGLCMPNCPEGALQVIDGKARLVSDLFCDGLGACVGHCPQGAMDVVEREAAAYSEGKVMENIIKAGPNTIKAHLSHLKDHGEMKLFKEATEVLKKRKIAIPVMDEKPCCPGSRMMDFGNEVKGDLGGSRASALRQWPVQLHLVPPNAPYYQGKDVMLIADCVGYAYGDLHKDFISGKAIAIACPKLDERQEVYVDKLAMMIDEAKINTLTVMTMEVPCCGGLVMLAKEAESKAKRKIPLKSIVVGIKGAILKEDWI